VDKISIKVSFICFNLHPMFWFWLGLLFHFELVFKQNLWDFNETDCWTGTYGHQPVRKSFRLFVGSFLEGLSSRRR
jgi:hypothetical protein